MDFALTFDYRCPFARNAHELVVAGLRAGATWDVTYVPFSLSQAKVDAGQPSWDASQDSGLLALQVGVAVRDTQPERFADSHLALFALRHDHGGDLRDASALRLALEKSGADADAAFDHVESGRALATVREEHQRAAGDHEVWGVPTFVADGHAAFVRLMDRPDGDDDAAAEKVERVVGILTGWPDLNEFKHTTLPR